MIKNYIKGDLKMIYEINVSLNGQHFFATAPRSLTCEKHARHVFAEIQAKFPKDDGYKVTITAKRIEWIDVTDAVLHGITL